MDISNILDSIGIIGFVGAWLVIGAVLAWAWGHVSGGNEEPTPVDSHRYVTLLTDDNDD